MTGRYNQSILYNLRSILAKILVLLLIATTGQAFPIKASAAVDGVSITLGELPVENGIHAWAGDNPNGLLKGTVAGVTYCQTNKAASPGTYYLYMNVDDTYLKNNTDQDVQVTVKYFDEGNGKMVLQYGNLEDTNVQVDGRQLRKSSEWG
jgi:hypothetical protein